jgi:hypothetical protein
MVSSIVRLALASMLLIWPLKAAIAQPADPQPGAVVETDPKDLSRGFWTDWNETKASPGVTALTEAVGYADKAAAAVEAAGKAQTQAIVPIGINRPEEAAKLLGAAVGSRDDPVTENALATVVNMRVAPETRAAAMPYVAPAVKERVETWNANLSTGIRGLPGIYLGGNEQASSGAAASAPAGYAPVSGGSFGCSVR